MNPVVVAPLLCTGAGSSFCVSICVKLASSLQMNAGLYSSLFCPLLIAHIYVAKSGESQTTFLEILCFCRGRDFSTSLRFASVEMTWVARLPEAPPPSPTPHFQRNKEGEFR